MPSSFAFEDKAAGIVPSVWIFYGHLPTMRSKYPAFSYFSHNGGWKLGETPLFLHDWNLSCPQKPKCGESVKHLFSFSSENSSLCPQMLHNCIRSTFHTRKKITRSCKYGMGLGLIVTLNVSLGCSCHGWAKRASDVLWAVRCSSLVKLFCLCCTFQILSKAFDESKAWAVAELPLGLNKALLFTQS